MFVGHYGVSFAAKRGDKTISLWVLFLAPPPSDRVAAIEALVFYAAFAAVAAWLERRRT